MDREAWYPAVLGVTKSRTRLRDWTELNWGVVQAVENKRLKIELIGSIGQGDIRFPTYTRESSDVWAGFGLSPDSELLACFRRANFIKISYGYSYTALVHLSKFTEFHS